MVVLLSLNSISIFSLTEINIKNYSEYHCPSRCDVSGIGKLPSITWYKHRKSLVGQVLFF